MRSLARAFTVPASLAAGTGSGTVTHSAGALTANRLLIGNGSDDANVLGSAGSNRYGLIGGSPPTWAFAPGLNVRSGEFGATGDSTTDDTAFLQAAIAAAISSRKGRTIFLPDGIYRLTDSLIFDSVQGLRFIGEGQGTRLYWDGGASAPVLSLIDCRECQFDNFQILPKAAANPFAVGIRVVQEAASTVATRHNVFSNIVIEGTTTGAGIGVQIGGATGIDNNNDVHLFENVSVFNYTDTAFSIEQAQSYGIRFHNCMALGGSGGQYGVRTNNNAGAGGNFHWVGGGMTHNQVSDFHFGAPNSAPSAIRDMWSEASARFLTSDGPSGTVNGVTVDCVRWAADAVAADKIFINFKMPGPVTIRGSRFGDSLPLATQLKINWDPTVGSAAYHYFVLQGNVVRRTAFAYSANAPTSDDTVVYP